MAMRLLFAVHALGAPAHVGQPDSRQSALHMATMAQAIVVPDRCAPGRVPLPPDGACAPTLQSE